MRFCFFAKFKLMKRYFCSCLVILLFVGCCKLTKIECNKYDGFHKYIYEPIVVSEDCNCIVSGKVKYLKDCQAVALIHYGDGRCDNIATKIICEDGDCFDKNDSPLASVDFTIDCNGNSITEGPISSYELNQLFDPSSGPQP